MQCNFQKRNAAVVQKYRDRVPKGKHSSELRESDVDHQLIYNSFEFIYTEANRYRVLHIPKIQLSFRVIAPLLGPRLFHIAIRIPTSHFRPAIGRCNAIAFLRQQVHITIVDQIDDFNA